MTLSTKARYAAFLLSKNSITGPNILKRFRRFSTKARYAAFLLSRNITIGQVVFQAALTIFQQKPGIQFFFFGNPHQLRSAGLRSHAIIENTQQSSASIWVWFASVALLQRHGCSAFAGWLRPIPARGI